VTTVARREEESFGVTVDDVRSAAPPGLRLLVLSNLNNPTGVALESKDVEGIADLAAERGFFVLVDETFRDLAFERPSPTMGGRNEHTIVTSSMSKFYGAGALRIGWVRAAVPIRERIRRVLDYLSVTPAGPSEAIALTLLRNRAKTVARNRRLIEDGRKVAREWAEDAGVAWQEPVAHLAFPRIGGDTRRLAEVLLRDHETFIAPGETFGLGGHFRLNIGIHADRLREGLRRVTKARAGHGPAA
jgi:aspartate/methionine/tyrosine aminotransferase